MLHDFQIGSLVRHKVHGFGEIIEMKNKASFVIAAVKLIGKIEEINIEELKYLGTPGWDCPYPDDYF